jgi:LysM repeat protein
VYIVKSGDTLSKIAQRAGSTVEALSAANCLVDVNRIVTGDVLYVPNAGSPMGTPVSLSTEVALAYYGCAFPEIATITNLTPGQTIRGVFTLEGTANLANKFWFYRLEIRPDFSNTFIELERVYRPVIADSLGAIDTSAYTAGLYWVRLMVVDSDWRYPPSNACMIPVYFEPQLP